MNNRLPRPATRFVRFSRHPDGFTLIEIMIVVLIIGVLLAIAVPNFIQARESSRAKACVSNLAQLYAATQQYAIDNHLSNSIAMTTAQFQALAPTYVKSFPSCPSGGTYAPGTPFDNYPSCTVSGIPGAPSSNGTGAYAPPTMLGSSAGAGAYYHGLQ